VRLIKSLKKRITGFVMSRFVCDGSLTERIDRQKFFSQAFHLLSLNQIHGVYMEFGCRGGRSFCLAYHEAQRVNNISKFIAFDSFQGLPPVKNEKDEHPHWVEGAMSVSLDKFHKRLKKHGVPRASYLTIEGFYDVSLKSEEAKGLSENVALAFVDCDMYSSTKDVLSYLKTRFHNGMIIAFDDYFCHSSTQISGERKALLEFIENQDDWSFLPYKQFGLAGMSFILESNKLLN
jgi:hypothetical protein